MGSNETVTATTGGPRVIDVLTGTGRHRVQIAHFLWVQIGSWRPLGVGLVVGSRLDRIRRRCDSLELPESSGTHSQAIHGLVSCSDERIGRFMPRSRARAA